MKAEKNIIIENLIERINSSPYLMVLDYGGLRVDQFTELRKRLSQTGADCRVSKNTFVKRAARTAELPDDLESFLVGQTAIVTGEADVCAAAKALKTFQDEFDKPAIRGGVLRGKVIDEAAIKALAALPSREILLAQLLGVLNQPATRLARILSEPAASLARVLKAKADQG